MYYYKITVFHVLNMENLMSIRTSKTKQVLTFVKTALTSN